MARTKQTARKYTGGNAPRKCLRSIGCGGPPKYHQQCSQEPKTEDGMPTRAGGLEARSFFGLGLTKGGRARMTTSVYVNSPNVDNQTYEPLKPAL